MNFFSLKPKNKKEEIKNYETYKQAFDFCFDKKNDVNNIGVIGDYGTGKSTVIETYINNEILESEYDVLKVSILTLKNDEGNSLILLKNIIKQIVQNPKKRIEYNILKFKNTFFNWKDIAIALLFVFLFILIYFMNTNFLSKIFILNRLLNHNIPIEFFKVVKMFTLCIISIGFILFIYPKLFSGFKFSKISFSSKLKGEIEKSTDNLADIELDYLEYLIYLLKRNKKNLLLVIEDIDRYENIKVFEQLREVNNLLNNNEDGNHYKFIYAVGNSVFSDEINKDDDSIRRMYESGFKENISKFFDFTVNIVPAMDSQNSYEFIKLNYPKITEEGLIKDEDLFMISQYIDSPRILIDIMNDYQIMDKVNSDENKEHLKILYYSIMKSKFYNFYDIIHEIYEDLKDVLNSYSNLDFDKEIEKQRREEFISKSLYFDNKKGKRTHYNDTYITIDELSTVWETIKLLPNLEMARQEHGELLVYKATYSYDNIYLSNILDDFEMHNAEVIFSFNDFKLSRQNESKHINSNYQNVLKQYYEPHNEVILGIIKKIENVRVANPNKKNFYIRDFLNIDFIRLGIIEEIINVHDYNIYISSNYLALEDSTFIKSFNLNESNVQLLELELKDHKTILSKMKLEKIIDNNGLNVFLVDWSINLEKSEMTEKVNKLIVNSINSVEFVRIFLFKKFKDKRFSLNKYLNTFYKSTKSSYSLNKIFEFLSNPEYRKEYQISNEDVERLIKQTAIKNIINIKETDFKEEWFYRILIENDILEMDNEQNLLDLLAKSFEGFPELFNLILLKFKDKIIDDEEKFSMWIHFFNKHVQYFSNLLEEENLELITSSYKISKEEVNVKYLSSVSNDTLFDFLYSNKYFEYNLENINLIRDMLVEGYDSSTYVEYTVNKYTSFFKFIKENEEFHIMVEYDWDNQILFRLFDNLSDTELKDILNIIKKHSPIKIAISELIEQDINLDNLIIIFSNVWLYKNNYDNYRKIFFLINGLDGTGYRILLSDILNNSEFDLDLLFKDIKLIKQDDKVTTVVYSSILGNNQINLLTFENYIKEYDSTFNLAGNDNLSQEKLNLLFVNNKLNFSFFNLNFCNRKTLEELFNNKSLDLYTKISKFSLDEIIQILSKFDEEILTYLIKTLNKMDDDERKIEIILKYFNTVQFEDKKRVRIELENLLDKVNFKNKDIIKIKELLENKKGQRTVSMNSQLICDFLENIGIVNIEKMEQSDNLKLIYRV